MRSTGGEELHLRLRATAERSVGLGASSWCGRPRHSLSEERQEAYPDAEGGPLEVTARGEAEELTVVVADEVGKPEVTRALSEAHGSAVVVCLDANNAGRIPGPRYLANGPEIAVTGGALIKSTPSLSMTGEEITGTQRAEDTYFPDEEVAAVAEAHRRGKRVCAHARSAESVTMCVRNKVDIICRRSRCNRG